MEYCRRSWKKLVNLYLPQYSAVMSFIIELWMPILLSAVFVFIASSLIHMVFQGWHASDCAGLKGEAEVMRTLRETGNGPGEYVMPYAPSMKEMESPQFIAKMEEGPVARVTIMAGNSFHLSSSLVKWFIASLVISIICAYVAQFALAADANYLLIFRLTSVVAFCAYSFAYIHQYIWDGASCKVTAKYVIDGLIYALLTGGTFGWLMAA